MAFVYRLNKTCLSNLKILAGPIQLVFLRMAGCSTRYREA